MTRLLGLDLGERRIGVALAEDDGGARPLLTLPRRSTPADDAAALAELVLRHRIDEIVVGLPLEMSGAEGAQSAVTRRWADAVRSRLAVPFAFRDERLTSHLAASRVPPAKRGRSGGPPGRTRRDDHRARIDREAAAIILQDELDARRESAQ